MAADPISIQGLWPIVSHLPTVVLWLTKRYFTEQKLAQLVYLDLCPRHESTRIDLGQVATFTVHLQLINLSPFELELEVANFRLWCGGVTLDSVILKKERIASGAIVTLYLSGSITDGHATQIAMNCENNSVSLDGNIEFKCRLRSFAKSIATLSGVQAKFVNVEGRKEKGK